MQGKKIASRETWSMFHLTTSLERVGQWTPLSKLVKLDVSLIPSAASSLSGQKRCPRTTAVICLEVGLRSRRAKISVRLQDPPSAQVLLNQIHITFHNLPFDGQTSLTKSDHYASQQHNAMMAISTPKVWNMTGAPTQLCRGERVR